MDLETGDFHDWEVLRASDSEPDEDLKSFDVIEGNSIRSDYFSVDPQIDYSRIVGDGDVNEESSVESNNPSWIDPASPKKDFPKFSPNSGSDEFEVTNNELGFAENEKGEILVEKVGGVAVESDDSEKLWFDSSGIGSFEEEKIDKDNGLSKKDDDAVEAKDGGDKQTEDGDVVIGATKSGDEGEKRGMVWWRLPLELLKYCLFRINPVWTVPMAAAMMGFLLLGRRYYRMKKKKSKSMHLKVTVDDQKVSQFMSRAAQLNEVFSVVKRAPVIRPQLPAPGAMPWTAMSR